MLTTVQNVHKIQQNFTCYTIQYCLLHVMASGSDGTYQHSHATSTPGSTVACKMDTAPTVRTHPPNYSTFGKSLCTSATVRISGFQSQSCRCSVLLFHCIQSLNSGWSAIPVKCVIVWFSFYSLWFLQLRNVFFNLYPANVYFWASS
jgi:hypothetical protein